MKRAEFIRAYAMASGTAARGEILRRYGRVNEDDFQKAQRIAALRFWRVYYRTLARYTVAEVFPPLNPISGTMPGNKPKTIKNKGKRTV